MQVERGQIWKDSAGVTYVVTNVKRDGVYLVIGNEEYQKLHAPIRVSYDDLYANYTFVQ